jgi:endoglucanase
MNPLSQPAFSRMNRRGFIKTTLLTAATVQLTGAPLLSSGQSKTSGANPLPRWRGFNLTDFNSPNPSSRRGNTDDDLRWMVDWGFDFIRLPMAYPRYVEFDRSKRISPEDAVQDQRPGGGPH